MAFGPSRLGGKPKEMVVAVPLDDIAAITVDKNKINCALGVALNDGWSTVHEAVKMAKPVEFAETFSRLRDQAGFGATTASSVPAST